MAKEIFNVKVWDNHKDLGDFEYEQEDIISDLEEGYRVFTNDMEWEFKIKEGSLTITETNK